MMKIYITALIFFTFIFTSCSQNASKKEAIADVGIIDESGDNKPVIVESKDKVELNDLGDFDRLVPIGIINAKSGNVYEKYGIEFDGNFYTCDLAVMRINKKHFDIINVCDSTDFSRNEDFVYEVHPDELRIKTGKNEFVFTKIETAPVYELKITGDKPALKNKRISKFYTKQTELSKFKQHDCGEFEG